jgi:hypothetical protein
MCCWTHLHQQIRRWVQGFNKAVLSLKQANWLDTTTQVPNGPVHNQRRIKTDDGESETNAKQRFGQVDS